MRSLRNASAAAVRGCSATGSGCLAALNGGIVPTTGNPAAASSCLRCPTERSRNSRRKASPTPRVRPKSRPRMRFSRVWGRTGSAGVSAASTRLTRRLEPVWSLGTEAMKARATLLVSRLAVPGSASSTLRSISSVSVTGSAWTLACSWLGVSGRGSRRSAASAVARDSRIWANDFDELLGEHRSLEGGGDAAAGVGLGHDEQLGGALIRRGGADRGDDRAGRAQHGGRHDQDHAACGGFGGSGAGPWR